MTWAGVRWVLPPKGMSTLPAPMEPSNRAVRPRREAHFRLAAISRRVEQAARSGAASAWGTDTRACLAAPLVLRKARDRLATVWPRQVMTMRGSAVTEATG